MAAAPVITSLCMDAKHLARARRALMRRDPVLGALIRRVGPCRLPDSRGIDPFLGLIRVICSQQLSVGAANTIFNRVIALMDGPAGVTPAALRALDTLALRGAGVSGPKIRYLYDLAERVGDGRLDLAILDGHPDEEVIAAITAVTGLGRWSAEMFLIFRLNRPDVWPIDDLGIVKGVQKLYRMKKPPKPRTMIRLAQPWRPYRSVAAWYLWRIHEL
jgi:DNA-3-methyladenine glycosylase II